jgi:hypothetical protein
METLLFTTETGADNADSDPGIHSQGVVPDLQSLSRVRHCQDRPASAGAPGFPKGSQAQRKDRQAEQQELAKIAHPEILEIFEESNLSARFNLYRRDHTERGQSLYLCQILMHLKKWFPKYKEPLDQAITKIRFLGSNNEDKLVQLVMRSLRSFASTVIEISEDTDISRSEVKKILDRLIGMELVYREQHPASDDHRDELYFMRAQSAGTTAGLR